MLEINNVNKFFGGLKAVHNASMKVEMGSITGLIGPNGAGKTTLFNTIAGLYDPDEGNIILNNEDISFLNPEADALGRGYQLIQSKIALGSGGLTGKGFLEGSQSYLQYLPEKQTDFIFTLIGEEFGFIGTMFIILLFLLLISVCFYISVKSNHIFGRILSIGVGSNLFIYVIMNISMVSGLMPVVGIPLPLVSYGGSAMLAMIISLGLVLNAELNGNLKKFT